MLSYKQRLIRKLNNLWKLNAEARFPSRLTRARGLYLDLMRDCLTDMIYQDPPLPGSGASHGGYDQTLREYGWDWPTKAHTMIGKRRMENLRALTVDVIRNRVPGDLIETGVWRGGACIYMRAILKAYDIKDRRVWAADSYEGLPSPSPDRYPADRGSEFHKYPSLAVSLETVRQNFERYGLLDDQVVFLKGWFKETLPSAPIKALSLMRMDGDMYESTKVALNSLYSKLAVGGYVIVDDYRVVDACRVAVDEFRESQGVREPIREIDGVGVYWHKTERAVAT